MSTSIQGRLSPVTILRLLGLAVVVLQSAGGCHLIAEYAPQLQADATTDGRSPDASTDASPDASIDDTSSDGDATAPDMPPSTCENAVVKVLGLESAEDDGEILYSDGIEPPLQIRPEGESGAWYPDAIYVGDFDRDSYSARAYFRFKVDASIIGAVQTAKLLLWGTSRCTSAGCCRADGCNCSDPPCNPDDQWDVSHALVIELEDSTDAAQVDEGNYQSGRSMISASVAWPLIWDLGQYNESPNLASLINSLPPDESTNAYLQFWLKGEDNEFRVGTPDYTQTPGAWLELTWCP